MDDQEKGKLIQLFKEATSEEKPGGKQPANINQVALDALLVFLVCTIIPFSPVSSAGGIGAVIAAIVWLRTLKRNRPKTGVKIKITISTLVLCSIISGCSPLLFDQGDQSAMNFCNLTGDCRTSSVTGLWFLGIPIREATVDQAAAKGDIKHVRVIQEKTGFGLVGFKQVIVYGT